MSYLRLSLFSLFLGAASLAAYDLAGEPHHYFTAPLQDRFSEVRTAWENGEVQLDTSGELPFLRSLLTALQIPAASQLLVYSTTSLQLSLISPRNPRAIYFNEEVSIGYIPGGKFEIASWDPELGMVFFIFPLPGQGAKPEVIRADRCMNCHANEDTRNVPGLVVKSVIPGHTGGSLDSLRRRVSGHQIPFTERFGGWHVTGTVPPGTWANALGKQEPGNIARVDLPFGQYFPITRYLAETSDILPHLILEHQTGFINRVVEATWETRQILHESAGKPTAEQESRLDQMAEELVAYILFRDEAPLPVGGIAGDPSYRAAFAQNKKALPSGESLKDFDLKTRLFRHRCSYMVHTTGFQKMPDPMKQRVYRILHRALTRENDPLSAHLAAAEKQIIRQILAQNLPGWPR